MLSKIFIKNCEACSHNEVRFQYAKLVGILGIITNLFLSIIKIVIGLMSNSISIITDNYEVYNVTNTDENGFYMSDILDDISINVQSNNKNTFNEETYVKITITTIDNLKLEEKIVIDSYKF